MSEYTIDEIWFKPGQCMQAGKVLFPLGVS